MMEDMPMSLFGEINFNIDQILVLNLNIPSLLPIRNEFLLSHSINRDCYTRGVVNNCVDDHKTNLNRNIQNLKWEHYTTVLY